MRFLKISAGPFLVILLFFCFGTRGFGYEPGKGEKLVYGVKYLGVIPVGEAVIEVEPAVTYINGSKVFPVTCQAATSKWMSLLFKADAVIKSYVDVKKIYPYRFEQVLRIAGRPDDLRVVKYDRVKNVMDAQEKGVRNVPPDVRDSISALFFLRTQPLADGLQIKQMVNNNQSNYAFDSRVNGKKVIKGVSCWKVDSKVRRENKSMYHSMDVTIYMSADAGHVPILVKANTKVGPVTLVLKK